GVRSRGAEGPPLRPPPPSRTWTLALEPLRAADGAVLPRPPVAATRPLRLDGRGDDRVAERGDEAVDVVLRRLPVRDGDADRRAAVPRRAAEPDLTRPLNGQQRLLRSLVRVESEEHLVQHDVVQHLEAGQLPQAV